MLLHESIGYLAVFAEGAGRADLVEAHEPRVACDVSLTMAASLRPTRDGWSCS